MINKKEDYNNVPVKYCNRCLSLKILSLESRFKDNAPSDINYCGKCGSIEIKECHISEWDIMYNNMYNKEYLPEISCWKEDNGLRYHYFSYKNEIEKKSILNILETFAGNSSVYTLSEEEGRIKICRAI